MTKSRGILGPRRYWTASEIALLRDMYPDVHSEDVAAWLDCSIAQVYRAATEHGVRKSAEYLSSVTSCRITRAHQSPKMIATRFQPGSEPWNKGTHYVSGGRSAEFRFKKGSKPQTWLPIGTYRLLKSKGALVLERKTSDRPGANHMRWTPVSRIVWEAAHGPVPAGHVVVFKPGMATTVLEEITIDRLDCITRADLARRNHVSLRHPELARLVQLKGAITRQVNRITKEAEQRTSP